jgi:hypothetical protein
MLEPARTLKWNINIWNLKGTRLFQIARDYIMQISNDFDGYKTLHLTICDYYKKNGSRNLAFFANKTPDGDGECYIRFLMDRKHVIQCSILTDRGINLTAVLLAIGPHYFTATDFWSYENSRRFKIDASTESVIHNLRLMDEFLGYGQYLPRYD